MAGKTFQFYRSIRKVFLKIYNIKVKVYVNQDSSVSGMAYADSLDHAQDFFCVFFMN